MPAAKKIESITKLGLIAGGGILPKRLVETCRQQGIETFIIGFKGQTDVDLMHMSDHQWAALGSVKLIFKSFKERGIRDLVMIGKMRRPHLREIRPDLKAAQILARIGFRALGDNGLLSALRKELEAEGFALHGIHEFCRDLLAEEKAYSHHQPTEKQKQDIAIGIQESQKIGLMDLGQAVVVHQGKILGTEGKDGTDALIHQCAIKGNVAEYGPILIKTCKPQQDRDLDMPTIGPETIRTASENGFSGVVFEAGSTLVVDPKTIEEMADHYNMFVLGVRVDRQGYK